MYDKTDDQGVLNTNLSREYAIVNRAFKLDKEKLKELSYQSINYTFADETTKNNLKEVFTQRILTMKH